VETSTTTTSSSLLTRFRSTLSSLSDLLLSIGISTEKINLPSRVSGPRLLRAKLKPVRASRKQIEQRFEALSLIQSTGVIPAHLTNVLNFQ
jgi:hypothetical protein